MPPAFGLETQRLQTRVGTLWADEFQLNLREVI